MDTSEDSSTPSHQKIDIEKQKAEFLNELDAGYQMNIPLALIANKMIDAGLSKTERNQLVLASNYAKDEKIKNSVLLFGFR